jgi:hypothetical protein
MSDLCERCQWIAIYKPTRETLFIAILMAALESSNHFLVFYYRYLYLKGASEFTSFGRLKVKIYTIKSLPISFWSNYSWLAGRAFFCGG